MFLGAQHRRFNGFRRRQTRSPGSLGNQLYGGDLFKALNSGNLFVNDCFRVLFPLITISYALDSIHFCSARGSGELQTARAVRSFTYLTHIC